jgi:hypothetical protein
MILTMLSMGAGYTVYSFISKPEIGTGAGEDAKVLAQFLLKINTSNKPFEWTGEHELPASPPMGSLPATQGQR